MSVFDNANTYNRALRSNAEFDTDTTHGVVIVDNEGFYYPKRIVGHTIAVDHVDIISGDIVVHAGTVMTIDDAQALCRIGYGAIPCLTL